ncbi:MAG: hypothetical protein ACYDCK_07565 [Thermoplasmatota archaeon]
MTKTSGSAAAALLFFFFGSFLSLSGGAAAATTDWSVTAHDNATSYWFTIIANSGGCTSVNDPPCKLDPGDTVDVAFVNSGSAPHDFYVLLGNTTTQVVACCVAPHNTASGKFTIPSLHSSGAWQYRCSVHGDFGMHGALNVSGDSFPLSNTTTPTGPSGSTTTPGGSATPLASSTPSSSPVRTPLGFGLTFCAVCIAALVRARTSR